MHPIRKIHCMKFNGERQGWEMFELYTVKQVQDAVFTTDFLHQESPSSLDLRGMTSGIHLVGSIPWQQNSDLTPN
jgi:hypothetical protein